MIALVMCLTIAGAFGGLFFQLGRQWERTAPIAPVIVLPRRHASHHHRPSSHVRRLHAVPSGLFDFDGQEPA